MHNWCKVPQHTMSQKTILEPSADSNPKRSTPSVSLKRKVRGSAAGGLGFGGCSLVAHAGHSNSRRTQSRTSGRARLRGRALKNSSLLGCPQLLWIFRHHSHRQEAFRTSPSRQPNCRLGQVRVTLSLPDYNKPHSSLSGLLWRRACEISQQVHSIFSWGATSSPSNHAW